MNKNQVHVFNATKPAADCGLACICSYNRPEANLHLAIRLQSSHGAVGLSSPITHSDERVMRCQEQPQSRADKNYACRY